jgi:hypothetical protein
VSGRQLCSYCGRMAYKYKGIRKASKIWTDLESGEYTSI